MPDYIGFLKSVYTQINHPVVSTEKHVRSDKPEHPDPAGLPKSKIPLLESCSLRLTYFCKNEIPDMPGH